MGATGALVLALARRRLTWTLMRQAMDSTAKLTSFVIFILIGSRVFSLTFYGVDGDLWVEHLLLDLPGGAVGFLIVVNILVFLLAFFLDFFELAFIIVPLLGAGGGEARHRPDLVRRAARRQHADLVHASAVRLRAVLPAQRRAGEGRTSTRSPSKTMAPVTTGQIYWGAVPFVVIQVIMVGARDPVPADGDGLQGRHGPSRPDDHRDRDPEHGAGTRRRRARARQIEAPAQAGEPKRRRPARADARIDDGEARPQPRAIGEGEVAARPQAKKKPRTLACAGFRREPATLLRRGPGACPSAVTSTMKLSKVFSATRNHRILLVAERLPGVVDLLELRVLRRDLVVELVAPPCSRPPSPSRGNGRSCVPPATSRRSAAGFCASYLPASRRWPRRRPPRATAW